MIERYVNANAIPYPILSDRGSVVAGQYSIAARKAVGITAMKPAVFLVDMTGKILYSNYLRSYIREPDNDEPLEVLRNPGSTN